MPSVREEDRDTRRINHAFRVYRTEAFAAKKCPPGMNVYRLGKKGKQRYITAPSFIEACYRWVMFDLHLGPWSAGDDEDAWRRDTYLDEEASYLARLVEGNGTLHPRTDDIPDGLYLTRSEAELRRGKNERTYKIRADGNFVGYVPATSAKDALERAREWWDDGGWRESRWGSGAVLTARKLTLEI